MPDTDDTKRARDAAADAAQVLAGLAGLLRMDDPQMPDPEQREGTAALFDHVANELLAANGLDDQCLQAADEWTGSLSFLLGVHHRQQALGIRPQKRTGRSPG